MAAMRQDSSQSCGKGSEGEKNGTGRREIANAKRHSEGLFSPPAKRHAVPASSGKEQKLVGVVPTEKIACDRTELTWHTTDPNARGKGEKTIRNDHAKLERMLHSLSRSDIERASLVVVSLLKNKKNRGLRDKVLELLPKDKKDVGGGAGEVIAEGVRSFLQHNSSKGSRPGEVQNAIDAVTTASVFAMRPGIPKLKLADFLGATRPLVDKAVTIAEHMKKSGELFKPPERKVRSDCVLNVAKTYVDKFCHDDAYSRVDSRKKARVHKVKKEGEEVSEEHRARFWRVSGMAWRHEQFVRSPYFKQFQDENPGMPISETTLYKLACKCVQNPPIPKNKEPAEKGESRKDIQ